MPRSTSPTTASPPSAWSWRAPDAIVMHPQPMNRGIEIASDVADGPQSVIRDQVRNGVAVRMAVLGRRRSARAPRDRERSVTAAASSSRRRACCTQLAYDARAVRAARGSAASAPPAPRRAVSRTSPATPTIPMRRPLSIMRADARAGWIEVLYKVVGAGPAGARRAQGGRERERPRPHRPRLQRAPGSGRARCSSAAASASRRWCSSPSA